MQWIYPKKSDAMRRIVHLVSHGYTRYVDGSVSPSKAEALALKFLDRYELDRSAQTRWRYKKNGLANSYLVMYPESRESIRWYLLVTEGDGLVTQMEKLVDAGNKRKRLQMTGYELVKVPKSDVPADWSWKMTAETEQGWRDRFHIAITHRNDLEMRQCLHSLGQCPGFSEIRKQAYGVYDYAVEEWGKHRKNSEPWPYKKLGMKFYGRYQEADKRSVRDLRKKPSRNEAK